MLPAARAADVYKRQSVTGWAAAQEVKGDAKAAEGKIAMCIGCHGIVGYKASFPEVYQVPKISGQNDKYIEACLVYTSRCV